MKKTESSTGKRFWISMLLLFALLIVSVIVAAVLGNDTDDIGANTAVIRIIGPISADSDDSVFAAGSASSTEIIEQLERARDDESITAVMLELNTPGGSAVASDEIAQSVKEVRAANKTVVAWIRESGASGGYWIASSSDHIVANRMSITGSIGVISSYLEFDKFIDDWNVTYNRLTAGDKKDIGDPFTDLTPERRAFMQHKLNRVHKFFIEEVARNRNMTEQQVTPLATGEFFLGIEAYEVGLVDEIGGKNEAIAYIENKTGESVVLTVYEPEKTFFDELLGIFSGAPKQDIMTPTGGLRMEQDSPVPMLR